MQWYQAADAILDIIDATMVHNGGQLDGGHDGVRRFWRIQQAQNRYQLSQLYKCGYVHNHFVI